MFAIFITSCGWTHFLGYWTFEHPWMRLDGLIKLITALVSWATVLVLAPFIPKALAMQSPETLEQEVKRRTEELQDANAALRASHEETQILNARLQRAMRETHHRVKNNLQVVSALVDMQILDHAENVPAGELRRIAQHINALAAVHDLLTSQAKSGVETEFVSLAATLERLTPLIQSLLMGRALHLKIEDASVPIGQANSFAVLVNELISNAVKHGKGDIWLEIEVEANEARLIVRDNGPGFPEGFDLQTSASTGLSLVESLAGWDLGGTVVFSNQATGGGCVTVTFPVTPISPQRNKDGH